MPETKEQKFKKIHELALKDFDRSYQAIYDEREQCLEDRRFATIAGAQWEGDLKEFFEDRPMLEINKLQVAGTRLMTEFRNNSINITFIPSDENTLDETAGFANDLFRACEYDSDAEEAYDNAYDEACTGGIGGWRLRNIEDDEEDEYNEYQKIIIEPIYDADSSIFFDPNAKKQNKSDARYCFVLYSITPEAYEEQYGSIPNGISKPIENTEFDWYTNNSVYIAEYYKVENIKQKYRVFVSPDGEEKKYLDSDFDEDDNLETVLALTGYTEIEPKTKECRKVHKYIVSGDEILEDCGYIAGKYIPIIPEYGKRWFIDNIERCCGYVRYAKDPQRLLNVEISKLTEISALSPVEKPLLSPEQVQGLESYWRDYNKNNYAYLPINPLRDDNGTIVSAQPLGYTKAPSIPPATAALIQLTNQDLQDVLGTSQTAEEINPNVSGKAIELVQNRIDMQSAIYIQNAAKARQWAAEVWLSMAKEIYSEKGRKVHIINQGDSNDMAEIMEPIADPETNEIYYANDLSNAKLKVVVSVGATTQSKRDATMKNAAALMPYADDTMKRVLSYTILNNMEGEGIEEIRKYARRELIRAGVIIPTDKEAEELMQELQNIPPNPNDVYLENAAMNERAKAEKAMAEIEHTRTKNMQILSDIENNTEETMVDTIEKLSEVEAEQAKRAIEMANQASSMQNTE